jgi:antitoxin (DNA-binding transcriptional repressor) of toxin-antitoxin stability system
MTTKLIGVREFRQNIAELYKKAKKNNLRYIVLNRNKPIFKIEPLSEKDAIVEKLAHDIDEARKEVKSGKTQDFEEICKELGL